MFFFQKEGEVSGDSRLFSAFSADCLRIQFGYDTFSLAKPDLKIAKPIFWYSLTDGIWFHMVVTYDGTVLSRRYRVFINGFPVKNIFHNS